MPRLSGSVAESWLWPVRAARRPAPRLADIPPVLIGGVAGLDPDAVNGQQLAAKQIQLPAQAGEFARDGLEGGGVVLAEVGNGFEVGLQLAQQPEDFQVAPAPG
jgi:hypothetical protein